MDRVDSCISFTICNKPIFVCFGALFVSFVCRFCLSVDAQLSFVIFVLILFFSFHSFQIARAQSLPSFERTEEDDGDDEKQPFKFECRFCAIILFSFRSLFYYVAYAMSSWLHSIICPFSVSAHTKAKAFDSECCSNLVVDRYTMYTD